MAKQYYFSLISLTIIFFNLVVTVQLENITKNEGNIGSHDTGNDVKIMKEFFNLRTASYIRGNVGLLIIVIMLALFCYSLIICPFICFCRLTSSEDKGKNNKEVKKEEKTKNIDEEPGLAVETEI